MSIVTNCKCGKRIVAKDEHAGKPPDPEKSEPNSALTGRSLEDIASEAGGAEVAPGAGKPAR